MKIQCDVCSGDEASVFCCADEAALCDSCDQKVHHANKVASKHRRFSLSSSMQTQPFCDICKEKRGFVFCQEDRAILCRDCDDPIHSANEHTMKHNRFLLTGTRLSEMKNANTDKMCQEKINQNNSVTAEESSVVSNGSSSSSISEYLTKTLPGYCVEDLLVDDFDGIYKNDEMWPYSELDLARKNDFAIWVPHVPQIQSLNFLQASVNGSINYSFGTEKLNQNQQRSDDSFMVPQINSPVSSNNKRS